MDNIDTAVFLLFFSIPFFLTALYFSLYPARPSIICTTEHIIFTSGKEISWSYITEITLTKREPLLRKSKKREYCVFHLDAPLSLSGKTTTLEITQGHVDIPMDLFLEEVRSFHTIYKSKEYSNNESHHLATFYYNRPSRNIMIFIGSVLICFALAMYFFIDTLLSL